MLFRWKNDINYIKNINKFSKTRPIFDNHVIINDNHVIINDNKIEGNNYTININNVYNCKTCI